MVEDIHVIQGLYKNQGYYIETTLPALIECISKTMHVTLYVCHQGSSHLLEISAGGRARPVSAVLHYSLDL